jgi:hypothetical protein
MFSPSKDPSDEKSERYRTCIQELIISRLQVGISGSKPDELLPVEEIAFAQRFDAAKDRRLEENSNLYPAHQSCPFHGCWNFGFTAVADAKRHESIAHPGQRAQRLQDRRR